MEDSTDDHLPAPGLCRNTPDGGPADTPLVLGLGPYARRPIADTALAWPVGSTLRVRFLNGTDAWGRTVRAAVQELGPQWSQYANVRFQFVDAGPAELTINLVGNNGYSCY